MYCVKEHALLLKSSHWERLQNENTYSLKNRNLNKYIYIYIYRRYTYDSFVLNLCKLAACRDTKLLLDSDCIRVLFH